MSEFSVGRRSWVVTKLHKEAVVFFVAGNAGKSFLQPSSRQESEHRQRSLQAKASGRTWFVEQVC